MEQSDTTVAVFADHATAENAIKKLAQDGFAMKNLSIVGKGYHTDEKVIGFYNIEDRIKFWGTRGAFWGGLWGLFFGGVFMTIPVVGSVVMLGYIASVVIATVDSAVILGVLGVLGAAIYSIGIPEDKIIQYETDVKADNYLVMAHGVASEVARAKTILDGEKPVRLNVYDHVTRVKSAA